jgi:chaperonin GroES
MALKPLHDRVLVRRVESDVAAGEGARKDNGELIAMAVKEGDKILFGKWSGTEVTIDGEELLIMKESDVLGILS